MLDELGDAPSDRTFPSARRADVKAMLMTEVRRTHRWWHRPIAIGIGTAVAGASIAAGSYVTFRAPTNTYISYCFSQQSLNRSHATQNAFVVKQPSLAERVTTGGPAKQTVPTSTQLCELDWSNGIVRRNQRPAGDPQPGADLHVPKLVACTMKDSVAVYPGNANTCRKLGLPSATR